MNMCANNDLQLQIMILLDEQSEYLVINLLANL